MAGEKEGNEDRVKLSRGRNWRQTDREESGGKRYDPDPEAVVFTPVTPRGQ